MKFYRRFLTPMFDKDGGAGSGGDGNQDGGGAAGDGNKDAGKQEPFAVFQDAKSFMDRVKREAKSQLSEMMKELGFESVEAAKAFQKQRQDEENAKKTEAQKALEEKAKAEQLAAEIRSKADRRAIVAELKVQAMALGVPADRIDAAIKLTDLSAVKVNDDDSVTGAKEAIDACLKANAFLKATAGSIGTGTNPGAGGSTSPADLGKKMAEERNKVGFGAVNPWAKKQ